MAAPVNALTQEQKEFVVLRLASFEAPRDIALAMAARFPGVKFNENDVRANDPRISVVAPELFMLFRKERERVLDDPAAAPYADQKARLIALSNMAESYKNNNQWAEARAVLQQIAAEQGIGGKGGKAPPDKELPRQITEIVETIVDPGASSAAPVPVE
jgi:hypothetical protein